MSDPILLTYLGSTYFNQDYDLDADTPIDLVGQFALEDGLQIVQLFYSQLAEILISGLTEEGARALWLDDTESEYDPKDDGLSYLEWLTSIVYKVGEVLRTRWLTPRDSMG